MSTSGISQYLYILTPAVADALVGCSVASISICVCVCVWVRVSAL